MLFLTKRKDGGELSPVTGYWLIEIKSLFSIVLLKFNKGSRENYHSHAFNGLTWFIKGEIEESRIINKKKVVKTFKASFKPKFTPRSNLHKVFAKETTYALSFRGPWTDTWTEFNERENKEITLTNGRKIVSELIYED